jgi:sodium/hydrogen exchanger 8
MYATISQNYEDNNGYIPPTYEEGSSSGGGLRMKLKEFHKRYLLPHHVFPLADI